MLSSGRWIAGVFAGDENLTAAVTVAKHRRREKGNATRRREHGERARQGLSGVRSRFLRTSRIVDESFMGHA